MKTLEPPAHLATAFKEDARITQFDCNHIEGSLYSIIIHFRGCVETVRVLVDFDALIELSMQVDDLESNAREISRDNIPDIQF
jgi:hypothetical protein